MSGGCIAESLTLAQFSTSDRPPMRVSGATARIAPFRDFSAFLGEPHALSLITAVKARQLALALGSFNADEILLPTIMIVETTDNSWSELLTSWRFRTHEAEAPQDRTVGKVHPCEQSGTESTEIFTSY